MKAVVIENYGGKEELKEKEVAMPKAGKNQVIVKEAATSINPIDWKLREGYLKQMMDWEFPIILGWDVAGVISEVGEGVTDWKVGDEVFARPETTRFGTYAEYTAVDDHLLAPLPEGISFDEAASIPLAGLTAWQALFDHAKLQKGEKVLIHAGAGGVGTLAIQLAKHAGAEVITTASAKNHELLKSLGADQVIDYKEVNFKDVLSDIDVVFDTMGGQIETDSYDVLKEGTGRLVSIVGISNEDRAKEKNVTATGIWLQPNGEQLKELGKLLANKTIKPIVGATFPFSEKGVFDAHALSETHHAVGKIVISFNK
ncbi:NADP-dependent oxidoreductase [Listeria monocytogenes]|jgi:NADPH:quinone reductase and related Zn-dependent oxidoreductases|uniref:Lmo0613 protein n=4 Tax=Listeria monocytogenes TaxID=1639 RepID=Q8Y9B9_LISMO|nr:NADP-dependent oxidoreductase [Listeria monocytogenes]NP_464140.1 oxidoreductase [Listeria monocytogenes EGD-e]EAA0164519.1 NADP-dependent oxidoreductase [Listeria monocytogenes serotype 1/2a]EAD3236249.1 NADP-dependent oxidoreductase [Listeria monocytogenes CFSAN002202]EAE3702450.1 NADP-dependent oxidoreductase [Listeria monocytogenes serotype 1/2c]EAF4500773.1 NADP-dependent oxidoreductase [Listeria monocytogenes serotype 4b]EAG6254980.1 NADP-dependent oxidoreductase [Listeria monocytoge